MNSAVVLILSPLCAVAGFLLKLYADKYTQHKLSLRDRNITALEYKLKEFYFPFYTNLKSETIVSNLKIKGEAVFELEKFVLARHLANQKIIMDHMVAVNPDKTLQKLLTDYSDHITLYKLLHDVSGDNFMLLLTNKIEYPKQLFALVETELVVLRSELDALHNSMV